MEKINCVCERKVKRIYKNLIEKTNIDRPISGAVLNIIANHIFTPDYQDIVGIDSTYRLHDCSFLDSHMQIEAPIITIHKKIEEKSYTPEGKGLYFLNSFSSLGIPFPENVAFKESNQINDIFQYYYVDSTDFLAIPVLDKTLQFFYREISDKLIAISEFYNSLLTDNSTTEGTFVLINVILLLFNAQEITKTVSDNNVKQMQSYIFNELQKLDENKNHKLPLINIDYRDNSEKVVYNVLEFRVINGFCKAFNRLSPESKKIIKNIFNETSRNSVFAS